MRPIVNYQSEKPRQNTSSLEHPGPPLSHIIFFVKRVVRDKYSPWAISDMFVLEVPEEERSIVLFVNCDMSKNGQYRHELKCTLRAFLHESFAVVQEDHGRRSLQLHRSVEERA